MLGCLKQAGPPARPAEDDAAAGFRVLAALRPMHACGGLRDRRRSLASTLSIDHRIREMLGSSTFLLSQNLLPRSPASAPSSRRRNQGREPAEQRREASTWPICWLTICDDHNSSPRWRLLSFGTAIGRRRIRYFEDAGSPMDRSPDDDGLAHAVVQTGEPFEAKRRHRKGLS